MMKRYNKMYIFWVSLFFSPAVHAVIVGSNESVSVQSHVNFPAADADNSIQAFAWMQNGFSLEDINTTCTFNSVYPVSGALAMNQGSLILHQDLIFKNNIALQQLGHFIGNGHAVDFSHCTPLPTTSPDVPSIYEDVILYTTNEVDFTVTHTLFFRGNSTLAGNAGSFLNLLANGFIVVDTDSTLTIRGLTLHGVQDQNIQCIDDSGKIMLEEVTVIQTGDYSFSKGSMSVSISADWQGSFTFLYDSLQSSTIQVESTFLITGGLTFSTGRVTDGAAEPLLFVDQTSILLMNDAALHINSHGARFTKGRLETTGIATFDVNSTSTATALEFGDNIAADDMLFHFNDGSTTNFNSGMVVFNITTFSIPSFQGSNVTVEQGPASINYFAQNYELNNIILNLSPLAQTIIAPGKQLLLNNVTSLTASGGSYVVTGYFLPGTGFLLDGNQSMNIVSGTAGFAMLINNPANFLTGAGNITYPIVLLGIGAELTWALTGQLQTDLLMNGGSISLAGDMNLGHLVHLVDTGTVHLNNFTLNTGIIDYDRGVGFNDAIYWDGGPNSGAINMESSIALNQVWTFSGQNLISGNGNFLDLTDGALVIEKGSLLELRNLTVEGLSGTNIQCLDDEGRLILHNVTWSQNGDFMFTTGTMILQGNTAFKGIPGNVLAYQSDAPAIIRSASNITLDAGFTFSYDAPTSDLLQFTDNTSVLVFNGGALYAAQDLNLIGGSIILQNTGFLSSAITTTVTLGDCISSANDTLLTLLGGAQLSVSSGSLNYKNVNMNSLVIQNFFSNIFMANDTTLNLYQALNVGTGFITFGNSTLGRAPGMELVGAANEQGVLNFVMLPAC